MVAVISFLEIAVVVDFDDDLCDLAVVVAAAAGEGRATNFHEALMDSAPQGDQPQIVLDSIHSSSMDQRAFD